MLGTQPGLCLWVGLQHVTVVDRIPQHPGVFTPLLPSSPQLSPGPEVVSGIVEQQSSSAQTQAAQTCDSGGFAQEASLRFPQMMGGYERGPNSAAPCQFYH